MTEEKNYWIDYTMKGCYFKSSWQQFGFGWLADDMLLNYNQITHSLYVENDNISIDESGEYARG